MGDALASMDRVPARARVHAGLRLQIVLALAGLMLLAFGPLYFAVASLTRATVLGERDQAADALGRAVATHVFDALRSGGVDAARAALARQGETGVLVAACLFDAEGRRVACGGGRDGGGDAVSSLRPPAAGEDGRVRSVRGDDGRPLPEYAASDGRVGVVVRMRIDSEPGGGQTLVRLVALYMGVFAFALIVFAAFALTRLIVRPVEGLASAADRVAGGARNVRFPRAGARELVELGASVQAMTETLVAEEATLRSKVAELTEATARLTAAQSQLVRSERMASVGRLAAGLAHEIGNPLAAIMGMQDLLLAGGAGPDDALGEEARDFLQRMRRETERIHTVVRDLLDFARPEGDTRDGRAPTAPEPAAEPADVRTILDDVAALVRPQPRFRAVRLELHVDGEPRAAMAAPRLTQVLLNLVLNAGSAVTSRAREGRVTVRARESEGQLRIEVEDDGPGVEASVRDRLFEPFVTTKDVGEGTGLGLAVCRGVVEAAGGEIGLDGSYAGGARFYVVVPSVPGPRAT